MGGRSSSEANTTSVVDTTTINANQAGAGLALLGDSNSINLTATDGGAVENAIDFGSEAVAQAFEFGGASVDNAFNLSREVVNRINETNRDVLNRTISVAEGVSYNASQNAERAFQFAQSVVNPNNLNSNEIKYITAGLTVLGIAAIALKAKK